MLLAGGVAAGAALAAGRTAASSPQTSPKPDPPPPPPPAPKPPPPPPPPPLPPAPPPPAVVVQAPPPPAPVRHKRPRPKLKKAAHRKRTVVSQTAPLPPKVPPAPKLALGGTPTITSAGGGSSPAVFIIGFGVLLGLLGAGVAFAPRAALPPGVNLRLEPHRETILVTGLAIGVACALVGILTALAG